MERYRRLNNYLKNKLGARTLKIGIDGGFTCHNRDGTAGFGGCIFCSEQGSGEHLNRVPIEEQIRLYFESYRSKRAEQFIAYFQNFTNTYDSVKNLKAKYDAALQDKRIVGLAIATRPDCITEEIAKLIQSYSKTHYVWVELGLQTANDNTALLINRGYSTDVFTKAVSILNKYHIDVVVHIMVGLPNETFEDLKNTVDFLCKHNFQGLKIHSCYVVKNTRLASLYENGKYTPISLEYYLESLVYILTHISPDIVIHRISGDAPKDLLLAPDWNVHKKWVLNGLDKILEERDLWQGKYF